MKTLTVALGERSYPIFIGTGILEKLPELLAGLNLPLPRAVVTDAHVEPLYANRIATPATCVLTPGEEHKRLFQIEALCGQFLELGMDRSSLIAALGGGVVGDMTGFAASVFMRGIRFIQIPTTIVAQVDSSVGGKTGVNHPLGKNTIGAFHQPAAVIIDMQLLKTLPDREVRAGMAEVIKHAIIADETLFAYLEQHADAILAKELAALEYPILRSCEIKADVVAKDERESGLRANLNYGHTFGHGIEAASHYTTFLHGEAVALGMVAAVTLAFDLGMVDAAFVTRQRACIEAFGLPVQWPDLPVEAAMEAMRHDKKTEAGKMKFVLPDRMGHVVHRTDIQENKARNALASLRG